MTFISKFLLVMAHGEVGRRGLCLSWSLRLMSVHHKAHYQQATWYLATALDQRCDVDPTLNQRIASAANDSSSIFMLHLQLRGLVHGYCFNGSSKTQPKWRFHDSKFQVGLNKQSNNFQSLEVVSRYRDPQLQVTENYLCICFELNIGDVGSYFDLIRGRIHRRLPYMVSRGTEPK